MQAEATRGERSKVTIADVIDRAAGEDAPAKAKMHCIQQVANFRAPPKLVGCHRDAQVTRHMRSKCLQTSPFQVRGEWLCKILAEVLLRALARERLALQMSSRLSVDSPSTLHPAQIPWAEQPELALATCSRR